jgi:cell division protease FtsH
MGLKQPIRAWNLTDRRETAYHEAGHAVAARYLRPSYRISKATIIRRGHALGYVQQKPLEERTSMYARWIETQIMVSLAGHVVENKFLDTLSTGPSSDLMAATQSAILYVTRFGMGPTKVIAPLVPNQLPPAPYVVAAHEMLDDLYAETERLLREKEPAIHHLAKALIERDELIGDELEEVFKEVETAHPELLDKFERKIIPFRDFAPPERQPGEGWAPQPAVGQEAAAEPAASVPDWTPPLPGSSRARYRRGDGPGMPTDVIPPWASRTSR